MPDRDVFLDTADVQQRHGLADPRAARRIIEQAGGRIIGGRWVVPLDLLRSWERAWAPTPAASGDHRRFVRRDAGPADLPGRDVPDVLDADWWQS